MRKRIVGLVSGGILMAILMLTGCGIAQGDNTARETAPASEEVSETAEPESEEIEEVEEDEDEDDSPSVTLVQKSGPERVFVQKATIDETIISEESGIIITAKEISYYETYAELLIEIENTTDQIVDVYSNTISYAVNGINGMTMDFGYVNSTVEPGMKAIEDMSIPADELRLMGMQDIASIVVGFKVSDDDYNDLFYTGPLEIRTSIYDEYDFTKDTFKEAVTGETWTNEGVSFDYLEPEINLEQDGVKILLAALAHTDYDDEMFLLEVKNDSDQDYFMTASNVAINGVTVYDGKWTAVYGIIGSRAVIDIDILKILDDYVSVEGLDKVGKIAFDLECRDIKTAEIIDTLSLEFVTDKKAKEIPEQGRTVYEEGGVRINALDVYQEEDDYYIPLLIENGTEKEINVDDEYDSLSVNGVMTDYYFYSEMVSAGRKALLLIEIDEDDLKTMGISSPDGITSAQITFEMWGERYSDRKAIKINIGE